MGVGEVRIRTALPESVYRLLRERADADGKPLSEVILDAVEASLGESVSLADDSVLSFLGSDLSDVDWAQRKAWRVIQKDPMSAFLFVRKRKMVRTGRPVVAKPDDLVGPRRRR